MIDELIKILNRENVEWEVYWEIGRGSSFKIENCELERAQRRYHSGIGLRVGYKGKQGFSYITGLTHSKEDLEKFVKKAIKLAKVGEVKFYGFPEKKSAKKVSGIYDKRIAELEFEEALELGMEISKKESELRDKYGRSYTFSGRLAFGVAKDGIVNSNGIEMEEEGTAMSFSVYIVRKDGKVGTGSYHKASRTMMDFERELEEGLEKAMQEVELSYNAKPLESFEGELVLEPHSVASILELFISNLRGDNVYHKRGRFNKLGESVASEAFTLVDDATLKGRIASYSFDGEGNPSQKTVLVKNGILTNFLLDETYARLLEMESTGNAVRDFRNPPHIGTSNIIVEGKEENLEDFEGVIIKKVFGEHTANPISGDFSLTVELGYVVKNGEIIPFKDNMFTGNIFEFMSSILAVGKKKEELGAFISPRVLGMGRIV
ncbi:TldE protein, part of TldE/TldD proteolytic complex [Thermococcus sp. 2319x1]|uniref:TldD/PmbA family protein n=1 Tax=Thermococcus sp. 2319x1 TaxID=1674923 RepID=UPI00073ACFDD|nr:TldD/PmbA family protein [Thermococcus sp. 2319x1]ALV62665.1 TldE protein, part of TldE/TldD proteolytic complex [Thermococcus sp. 2319x1]